jgi:hypothetical protein
MVTGLWSRYKVRKQTEAALQQAVSVTTEQEAQALL